MNMQILKIVPILAMLAGLSACGRPSPRPVQDPTQYIDMLIRELADSDSRTRQGAARALGVLGPRAAKAVPALECAQGDEESTVRDAATAALSRILPELAMAGGGR